MEKHKALKNSIVDFRKTKRAFMARESSFFCSKKLVSEKKNELLGLLKRAFSSSKSSFFYSQKLVLWSAASSVNKTKRKEG
jgi:hypothetical protein